MAEVHNPCRYSIFCHAIHREIGPFGRIRVTDEQAALIPTHVLEVLSDDEAAEAKAERDAARDEAKRPKTPTSRRKGAKARTGPADPDAETRVSAALPRHNGTVESVGAPEGDGKGVHWFTGAPD